MRFDKALVLVIATLFGAVRSSPAHPDLIDEITRVTAQINEQEESAERYQQRAELFRRHGQFEAALMDIAVVERLRTNSPGVVLAKARIFSEAGMAKPALGTIQKFLQLAPAEAEALLIRARAEAQLGQAPAAVADYTAAIQLAAAPALDWFLERARQQALQGRLAEAVRGLDEAMASAGPQPVLQMPAIEYDRQRGAFESALQRVDGFVNRYPVKEPWLTLRAEILEQAGRRAEARQTYEQVIAGIEHYPAIRRTLELTRQLENRVRQGLARTQPDVPTTSKT